MNTLSKSSSIALAIALGFSMLAASTSLNAQARDDNDFAGSERSINVEEVKPVGKPTVSFSESVKKKTAEQNAVKQSKVGAVAPVVHTKLQERKQVSAISVSEKSELVKTEFSSNKANDKFAITPSSASEPIAASSKVVEKNVSNNAAPIQSSVEPQFIKPEYTHSAPTDFKEKIRNAEERIAEYENHVGNSKTEPTSSRVPTLTQTSKLELKEILIEYLRFLESGKNAGKSSSNVSSEIETIKNRLATL